MSVHQHLLDCAADYEARARKPVVAWDCLGAEGWGEACRQFAEAVQGMSDAEAVAWLKAKRKCVVEGEPQGGGNLPGWYLQLDFASQFDRIIDPVAKDRTGWIEVGTHGGLDDGKSSTRPGYRRMLGTNRCVAFCGRERGESDDAWLTRRALWLGRYHPQVLVVRRDAWTRDENWARAVQYTQIVGTAGGFVEMRHLDERDEYRGIAAKPLSDDEWRAQLDAWKAQDEAERGFEASLAAQRAQHAAAP